MKESHTDRVQEIRERWTKYSELINARKFEALNNPQFKKAGWYFAICSSCEEDFDYTFDIFETINVNFKKISLHPLLEELSDALEDKLQLSRIWGYSSIIGYELFIEDNSGDYDFRGGFLAYYLLSALRVISGAEFIVPLACNYSLSCIPAVSKDSVKVVVLEDHPKSKIFDSNSKFTQDDFKWIEKYIANFYDLITNYHQFRIAVDTFVNYNQHANDRMCIVALWAGIEAILGVNQELSFRLAAYISAYLEPFGEERLKLFKHLKKMYSFRSQAVHGVTMKDSQINNHIEATKLILRKIIIKITESNRMPNANDFESILFM